MKLYKPHKLTVKAVTKTVFALALGTALPVKAALSDDAHLKVSSSLLPIHLLTRDIGGSAVDAQLILDPNQSAHHASFRPSQRRAVQNSDIVFAIGPKMESTLAKVMAEGDDKWVLFANLLTDKMVERDHDEHDDHDDHDEHDDHDDHDEHDDHKDHDDHDDHDEHDHHDDHDDHKDHDDHNDHKDHDDHDDHKDHDEHDHHDDHDEHKDHDDHDDHEGHDEHAHEGPDQHLWLSPKTMGYLAEVIYETMAERLPAKASLFEANYQAVMAKLDAADKMLSSQLSASAPNHFIAMHDLSLYLELSYPMEAVGFLLLHDHGKPSAAHLRDLQEKAAMTKASCMFTEPQIDNQLAQELSQDMNLKLVILDPLGASLGEDDDVTAYWDNIAQSLEACFQL